MKNNMLDCSLEQCALSVLNYNLLYFFTIKEEKGVARNSKLKIEPYTFQFTETDINLCSQTVMHVT